MIWGMTLDISSVRAQFPIFKNRDITYLDSAATMQKPRVTIEAMDMFYKTNNANIHRGMHPLTEHATIAYENARKTVHTFVNASHTEEIIFTKGCTESINLVAQCFTHPGDHIVLSILEHHSNIVPWMQRGAHIHWIDIDKNGELMLDQLEKTLQEEDIKLISITGQSNVTGYKPPLKKIIQLAHASDVYVLIDAAQLCAHHPIDVQDLDCDFLTFSGHKLYGPTGIGVLYAKRDILESMPPYMSGGMMIHNVTRTGFTPADIPHKFEAGTPAIAQVLGLATAIDWFSKFDWKDIEEHEQSLLKHTVDALNKIEDLTILGDGGMEGRSGCVSFIIKGIHPHDLTDILGQKNICLRAGHHCAQPLHDSLGIKASTRVSFGIYNTKEEIDTLCIAIQKVQEKLTTPVG
jgi:cysteine desulfurase / selenocysteine lyase